MQKMLNNMIALATALHNGQYDKAGVPYILHPIKVMHYLKTDDEELKCIAIGHDILEDTECTDVILRGHGLSDRVIRGIVAMTKTKGQSYEDYKIQVMTNPDAIRVKMADLRHNMDIRRLKGVTEKDVLRVAKYMAFYEELKEALRDE